MVFLNEKQQHYTAMTHAIACIHGAVGMLHRSFWNDLPLPLSDRFAGHLSHLQFRLYHAPSTKLVLDLLQVQDEVGIVLQVTKSQERILTEFERLVEDLQEEKLQQNEGVQYGTYEPKYLQHRGLSVKQQGHDHDHDQRQTFAVPHRPDQNFALKTSDLVAEVLDRLRREEEDLAELRSKAHELANRTVQLVNIRVEDHSIAILVFTLVTVIFLPLSFLASFFSMNGLTVSNIQVTFWSVAVVLTVIVVAASTLLAFYGGSILQKIMEWRENGSMDFRTPFTRRRASQRSRRRPLARPSEGFVVIDQSTAVPGAASW